MSDRSTRQLLESIELPGCDAHSLPDSTKRFADGAAYRIEIPSTEGPRCLEAALEEAERLNVPLHRVSQGSGVFLLSDGELSEFARIGAAAGVEVSLFARPGAGWGLSAGARMPGGGIPSGAAHGVEQLVYQVEDIRRAAAFGIRSVLIADIGTLFVFGRLRAAGELPPDMQAKVSVLISATNPASARVLEEIGGSTLNLASDLTLAQIAAVRAAVDVPLDLYIESPDGLGGFMRMHELPELIRVAAPVYIKFGLRNAPDLYPSGTHLEHQAVALTRERVRRARIGFELLGRSGFSPETSSRGAVGLAVPRI